MRGLRKRAHHAGRLAHVDLAAEGLDPVGDDGVASAAVLPVGGERLLADMDGEVLLFRAEDARPVEIFRVVRAHEVAQHEAASALGRAVDFLDLHRGGRVVGQRRGFGAFALGGGQRLIEGATALLDVVRDLHELALVRAVLLVEFGHEGVVDGARGGVRRNVEVRHEHGVDVRAVELAGVLELHDLVEMPQDSRERVGVGGDVRGAFRLGGWRFERGEHGIDDLALFGGELRDGARAAGAVAAGEEVHRLVVFDAERLLRVGRGEVERGVERNVLEDELLEALEPLFREERAAGVLFGERVAILGLDVGDGVLEPRLEGIHEFQARLEIVR